MDPFSLHLLATVIFGFFPLVVGFWVYTQGRGRPALYFALLLGAIAFMAEGLALQMLAPDPVLAEAIFYARQAAATTSGPFWILFALHYTGRDEYVTRRVVGTLAIVVGVLVAFQVTNPLHGLTYPSVETATIPFPFLVYTTGPLYWVGWAFSYVLIVAGLVMLFLLFLRSRHVSRQQSAIVMLSTTFPISVNVAEQIGVFPTVGFEYTTFGLCLFSAVAGIGIFSHQLFDVTPLARDTIVEAIENPVVVVDADGRIVDYNPAAITVFPGMDSSVGIHFGTVAPQLGAETDRSERFVDSLVVYQDGERRTFSVSVTPIEVEPDRSGHALVLKDVTDSQEYARKLEQQTEQLERVAGTISHDLRNPLTVAEGAIELAKEGDVQELDRATGALDRMQQIIDGTLELAHEGQAIGEKTLVPLGQVATDAWETSDVVDATLDNRIDDRWLVYADEYRLQTIFENLYRNAVEHSSTSPPSTSSQEDAPGASSGEPSVADAPEDTVEHSSTSPRSQAPEDAVEHSSTSPGSQARRDAEDRIDETVTVRVGLLDDGGLANGFYVEDDGSGIPESDREAVFDTGYSTDEDGTGLGLAIVESIASAHGWSIAISSGSDGGARFEFSDADIVDEEHVDDQSSVLAD